MNVWQVYLWLKLDSLLTLLFCTALLTTVLSIGFFLFSQDYSQIAYKQKYQKYSKQLFVLSIILYILVVITPSTKQATIMYVIPKMTHNKELIIESREELNLIKRTFNSWLGKQIRDNSANTTEKKSY